MNTPNDILLGKLPPQAIEYEEALIGALMLESEAFLNVSSIINFESFYKEEHRIIFQAIDKLYKNNTPVDLMTVSKHLKDNNELEKIGGAFRITELTAKVSSAAHITHYAKIIQQKYMQRQMILIASKIQEKAYDDNEDIQDTISFALSQIDKVENNINSSGKKFNEVVVDTFAEIENDCEKHLKGESSGIPTPLSELTSAVGGWKAPYFTVMGARPAVGKTTIALTFATHAAKAGYWVNFYSYEMLSTGLCKISLSAESGVNRTNIRDGKLDDSDWDGLSNVTDNLSELPIIMYDNPDLKASQIRANTHKNKLKGQCDLVIIDYLQLIPAEDSKAIREQQVSEISRILKRITTALKVPVIVLAQLNRGVESRNDPETFKSDLRESGSLEQDADIVLLPYNLINGDDVGQRILKIDKNRSGKTGKIEFKTDSQMTKIFDETEEQMRRITEPIDYTTGFKPNDDPF